MQTNQKAVYLKLGGSLITDKQNVRSPRMEIILRAAGEIRSALDEIPDLHLIVGHGSGSYGHFSAYKYGTRDGVHTPQDWQGFLQVWKDANELNSLVMDALHQQDVPAVRFAPSSFIISENRSPVHCLYEPISEALSHGLVPVVFGDVIFDLSTGGTIYSTEEVFAVLAQQIPPRRMLIAGIETGVFADYPSREQLINEITPENHPNIDQDWLTADTIDVTGGMLSKVKLMLEMVEKYDHLMVEIFSGLDAGNIKTALLGDTPGTTIHA